MSARRTIFVSVAEASGDAHAAKLINALRSRMPNARFVGVGGPEMLQAGCEPAVEGLDLTGGASMLMGAVWKAGYYWRVVRNLRRVISDIKPDVHVPVDSPAMNWHLAAAAKQAGAKVCYYIAPQVWAWAPWRVKKLARLTDRVACILPFEPDWLGERGVAGKFVGHPLLEDLPPRADEPADLLDAWSAGTWRVAMLPGSRPAELRNHSAALAVTAEAIRRRWPKAECTFAVGSERAAKLLESELNGPGANAWPVSVGNTGNVISQSHFAVAASGTITLAAAQFGVPMVVFYRLGRLTSNLLYRALVRTKTFSLVNILAGRRLVPEMMPWYGSHKQLIDQVLDVMDDIGWLVETRGELLKLTDNLRSDNGKPASENAAEMVAELVGD